MCYNRRWAGVSGSILWRSCAPGGQRLAPSLLPADTVIWQTNGPAGCRRRPLCLGAQGLAGLREAFRLKRLSHRDPREEVLSGSGCSHSVSGQFAMASGPQGYNSRFHEGLMFPKHFERFGIIRLTFSF